MKIKILKTTAADGRFVRAGTIVELSDRDARLLIELGKGVAVAEMPPAPPAQPLTTETAAEVIAPPARRGRPAKGKHGGF